MQGQFRFILVVIVIISCLSLGLKRHIKNAAEAAAAEKKAAEEKLAAGTNAPTSDLSTNSPAVAQVSIPEVTGETGVAISRQVQLQIQALNDILTAQIEKQAMVNRKIDDRLKEISASVGSGAAAGGTAGPDPRVIQLEAMMQVIRGRDLLGLSNRLQRVEVALTRLSVEPAADSNEEMQRTIDTELKGIREDAAKNRQELEMLRKQLETLKTSQTQPTGQRRQFELQSTSTTPPPGGGRTAAFRMGPVSRP